MDGWILQGSDWATALSGCSEPDPVTFRLSKFPLIQSFMSSSTNPSRALPMGGKLA